MKESTNTKREYGVDLPRSQSRVYLRSDTLFLQHITEKRLSQQTELNKEQLELLQKQSYIRGQKDLLKQSLIRQSLVPYRCVLEQIGCENVVLHALPEYISSIFDILNTDPYIRQLDLSYTMLSGNGCRLLSKFLWTNMHITTLTLHKCNMNGTVLGDFVSGGNFERMETIILSGNNITGYDSHNLCLLLGKSRNLKIFSVKSNHLETVGCMTFGHEIAEHTTLENIDMSWNHIRRNGAIDIARGIKNNGSLTSVNLSWNGFGYEGCSALSEALANNTVLKELNLACNRVHPPALLELLKGLCKNSSLLRLDLSNNPIAPAYTSIFLEALFQSKTTSLQELLMKNIVVDQDFPKIVSNIQREREFKVTFERSLPLHVRSERLEMEIQAPSVFNMDPLKLLYLLKEKNRAQDFFNKINKDNDDVVTIDELQTLFREMGIAVTKSVIEKIMEFMDTDESGSIDLGEFLEGDRRIRKMSRDYARSGHQQGQQEYNRHSRSFTRGHIDPMTFQLKIQEPKQLLPPIKSRESSISPVPR